MNGRDRVIEGILETELKMFLTTNPQQTSGCQKYPESFKLHRSAQFVPWSTKTLASYFYDLQAAQVAGQNLMRVKYACMQGLIANEEDPLIDQILRLTISWQKEMFRKYPGIMGRARPLTGDGEGSGLTSFEAYGRGELQTYSPRTLRLLHSDMIVVQERGGNWSEMIYEFLVKHSGYQSLAEAESYHTRGRQSIH